MKAIIPLAGKGTRLRPHTHFTPKPLLKVGGRPVMSYILDDLVELGVREFVFVIGYLGDTIRAYIETDYPQVEAHYVVQEVQDGTAGAIGLARQWADEDLIILFADTIFDADLTLVRRLSADVGGVLWAKEVDDYARFGVMVTGPDGTMQRIVEKPNEPVSRLANVGLYYVRDRELLFEGIDHTLSVAPGGGEEFFLTDAFQYMVDHGSKLVVELVDGWYDCGRAETLIAANRHLLDTGRGGIAEGANVTGTEVIQPVRIETGAEVTGGQIGPNVTVGKEARIVDSVLQNTIVGDATHIERAELQQSLLGDHTVVTGIRGQVSIGAHSELTGEP